MINAMLSQRPFRSVVALTAISSLGFLGLVAPSAASAGAVHFDPNSPAGKEYALPLAQARNEAAGRGGSAGASATSAPLFGAGISRSHSGSERISGRGGDAVSQQAGDERRSARRESAAGAGLGARLSGAGSEYPPTSGAGLVAVIVLLGGALGLALRGLQRVSSD
jgi:hypothetical protein